MRKMTNYVAPYVGAWIETQSYMTEVDSSDVAPYVGAWIETLGAGLLGGVFKSHPTWVRGLKLIYYYIVSLAIGVAPYVGAWIETQKAIQDQENRESHPTWVRGLKPPFAAFMSQEPCRTLRGCVD